MDSKSLSHTRWKCQYYIVFIPKYRKRVLFGRMKQDVHDIIKTLCEYKHIEIVEGASNIALIGLISNHHLKWLL